MPFFALRFEPARWSDYLSLSEYHYRAKRPATVHSVWRITAERRGKSANLLWQLGGYPALAAVAVVSYPVLSARARNIVTASRYVTAPPADGIRLLNREVRTISRVIVHPLYRGLGVAVALVRGVLSAADWPMTEAFARMGRYVPFFARAGMSQLSVAGGATYYWTAHRTCTA